MKDKNLIQLIIDADINAPGLYANTVEKDFGPLFYNSENQKSYMSNHAVITNPDADLNSAITEIIEFYHSLKQTPRIYQGFVDTEEELLLPLLRNRGFNIVRNEYQTFVRQPCVPQKCPAIEHPRIRRLSTVESEFCNILQEDDAGDWNVIKWKRCIQDPRIFAYAQPDENGDTAAIAVLVAHDKLSVLEDVVTAPNYRRKGFATSMLTQIIELHESMENGNPINLFADNPDAIRVYEKLGFKKIEHNHSFWFASLEKA